MAIGKIRKLYRIEAKIKDLDAEKKARQQLSLPVLEDLKTWLETNQGKQPKDSLTHVAIRYALNQWDTLTVYCSNSRLNISNARAENTIRPFAIGPRNWLFPDTSRGAKAY